MSVNRAVCYFCNECFDCKKNNSICGCPSSNRGPTGNRGAIVKDKEIPFVISRQHDSQPAVRPRAHISLCHRHRADFDANRKQVELITAEDDNNEKENTNQEFTTLLPLSKKQGLSSETHSLSSENDDSSDIHPTKKIKVESDILIPVTCLVFGGTLKQLDATAIPVNPKEMESLTSQMFLKRVGERMPEWFPLVKLGFRASKSNNPETISHDDQFKLRLQNFKFTGTTPRPRQQLAPAKRALVSSQPAAVFQSEIELRRRVVNTCKVDEKHKEVFKNDPEQTNVTLSSPPDLPLFDSIHAVNVSQPPYSRAFQAVPIAADGALQQQLPKPNTSNATAHTTVPAVVAQSSTPSQLGTA
ncbi:hypothetical protein BDR26DRAFT_964055 [Obelidium mucronatum]|nr:hypothetical protein BDR26DRAFT_964055 [Obelidium mucronatum]